jgi:hypothetical protein
VEFCPGDLLGGGKRRIGGLHSGVFEKKRGVNCIQILNFFIFSDYFDMLI